MNDLRESGNEPQTITGGTVMTTEYRAGEEGCLVSSANPGSAAVLRWDDTSNIRFEDWIAELERRLEALEGRMMTTSGSTQRIMMDYAGRNHNLPAPDLRTADERERDDIAALSAELAELRREHASILEAIQRHADALQVLLLRGEAG